MTVLSDAYDSLSDLNLWYNIKRSKELTLADIPGIISLRWPQFRDNWEFLKQDLIARIPTYTFPDELEAQIDDMSELVEVQRSNSNQNVNPFARTSILVEYYAVFANTLIASIPVSKEEQTVINNEVDRVSRFIKQDFLDIRVNLEKARDELADVTGGFDVDYNTTYDRSSVTQLRNIRIRDIQDMSELQNGIRGVDFVLANVNSLDTVALDPFALARENANNPNLRIDTGKSAQLVRMFYGDSLQTLANRYLGTPDRWQEIAIANGLRPPYIDEFGQSLSLLSNGSGNQLNIAARDIDDEPNIEKLYVGQIVFLRSETVKFEEQRKIVSLREVPVSGEIVLELDGDSDLDKYKTTENAQMRVYLPNTINSNFFVAIPTPTPLGTTAIGETPFFLSSSSEDEKRAGVDLLFDNNLDLVFTPTSDLALSFGLPNAIQAVQIKMMSEKGQNPRHPSFGLASVLGNRLDNPADVRAQLTESIREMIESDVRFDRIETLNVTRNGTAFLIDLEVRLAGSDTTVPITFRVNAS